MEKSEEKCGCDFALSKRQGSLEFPKKLHSVFFLFSSILVLVSWVYVCMCALDSEFSILNSILILDCECGEEMQRKERQEKERNGENEKENENENELKVSCKGLVNSSILFFLSLSLSFFLSFYLSIQYSSQPLILI